MNIFLYTDSEDLEYVTLDHMHLHPRDMYL